MRGLGRREALDAVARAVAQAVDRDLGDDLGFFARRRVARARALAAARVPSPGTDPVGERVHRLRVMWLAIAGLLLPNDHSLMDPALAERSYYTHLQTIGASTLPHEPVRWSAKKAGAVVGIVTFVGASAALAVHVATAPEPPVGDGELLEPAEESELTDAFTDWVIALDRWARLRHGNAATTTTLQDALDKLDARRARMLTPDVRAFLGEAAAERFDAVLELAKKTADGRDWEAAESDLAEGVRQLNRALQEAHRGYFLDSYAVLYQDERPETALYLFRVVARRTWSVTRGPVDEVEALHLRRLDHLNLVQLLLGYTSKRMDVAALLLDQLEEDVATRIGPSLAQDALMPRSLAEDEGDPPEWESDFRRAAGTAIRAAVEAANPSDIAGYRALGAGLAARVALQAEWNQTLAKRGMSFSAFDQLPISDALYDEVEQRLGARERDRLRLLQDELDTDDNRHRFAALLELHARSVEQHEVQHRLDYALEHDFVVPDALLALLGIPRGSALAAHDDVQRVALELSAYTSEIARDPSWAAVALTLISEHLIDERGGAEARVAVLVLDALREELKIPGLRLADTPPVTPSRAADAYLALIVVPPENLARAAQAVWERWFGRPLPTLTPVTALEHEGAAR